MKVLITGAAGFIGYHLSTKLLNPSNTIIGLDSINDYYDISLKYDRLKELGIQKESIQEGLVTQSQIYPNFQFLKSNLENKDTLFQLFEQEKFDIVINLAAQAGVRYSLENPHAYINSNVLGFLNILEACRHYPVKHLIYASSSSVYGANTKIPFSTSDNVDNPISLYAATKKSNELMAYTYSHLFQIPTTGLRFFTVYGPWGRPDMAYFSFTKNILERKPIEVFNYGNMKRDFTYIDDIVDGVIRVIERPPSIQKPPYKLYNIGNNQPIKLTIFVEILEELLATSAIKINKEIQPGDVLVTYADIEDLKQETGFEPKTDIKTGLIKFVEWYRNYYKI